MSMSDCLKCWETPCSCGYDYRHLTDSQFNEFIVNIIKGRDRYIEIDKKNTSDNNKE